MGGGVGGSSRVIEVKHPTLCWCIGTNDSTHCIGTDGPLTSWPRTSSDPHCLAGWMTRRPPFNSIPRQDSVHSTTTSQDLAVVCTLSHLRTYTATSSDVVVAHCVRWMALSPLRLRTATLMPCWMDDRTTFCSSFRCGCHSHTIWAIRISCILKTHVPKAQPVLETCDI